jgi:mono/diheme cytochrome c family protein
MNSASRVMAVSSAAVVFLALGGCLQDMARQPKHNPLSPSAFFGDGRSERDPVENTVARGALAEDEFEVPKDSNAFPLPVTQELLERGRERFGIFCSPCHGLQGDGNGMAAVRGMKHPPTYHQDRLRQAPVGHFYDVITHGFGAMYDYSAQIPPRDRWAIIAYVRALQLSRDAPATELPEELRRKLAAIASSPAGAPAAEAAK